jgi:hypothetical protein
MFGGVQEIETGSRYMTSLGAGRSDPPSLIKEILIIAKTFSV